MNGDMICKIYAEKKTDTPDGIGDDCRFSIISADVVSPIFNQNVPISDGGCGSLTIVEEKKHGRRRTIIPERYILSSPTRKSLKNWIDHWRPKVEPT